MWDDNNVLLDILTSEMRKNKVGKTGKEGTRPGSLR